MGEGHVFGSMLKEEVEIYRRINLNSRKRPEKEEE